MFIPSTARLDMASNVGKGGYSRGGSNVVPVRNESSTDTFVAMLASCSPVALQGLFIKHFYILANNFVANHRSVVRGI